MTSRGMARAVGIALALASGLSSAQGFPSKPVRIIVSHSAGGPPDVATRGLAGALSQSMGQPFVVENRDGANGIVGTEAVAKAYLEYLYSEEGQEIAARNFYRPRSEAVAAKHASQFPSLNLVTIDEAFGGWAKAQKTHFADGGVFDQIYMR